MTRVIGGAVSGANNGSGLLEKDSPVFIVAMKKNGSGVIVDGDHKHPVRILSGGDTLSGGQVIITGNCHYNDSATISSTPRFSSLAYRLLCFEAWANL
jgi:hypothetical protein